MEYQAILENHGFSVIQSCSWKLFCENVFSLCFEQFLVIGVLNLTPGVLNYLGINLVLCFKLLLDNLSNLSIYLTQSSSWWLIQCKTWCKTRQFLKIRCYGLSRKSWEPGFKCNSNWFFLAFLWRCFWIYVSNGSWLSGE